MDHVIVSKRESSWLLTLNRPDSRNALNLELISALRAALDEAATEERIRAVVITGAGSTFSAGADLAELRGMKSASLRENLASSGTLAALFSEIRRHPKVIIAEVNGHAIAGGCGLVVACDFAIATSNAKFGFTEVRIGFVPALVSALLRGRVADHHLRDLLLTGRILRADEAKDVGLVHSAVEANRLEPVVEELVNAIARETSPAAVAMTKRMLLATAGLPAQTASDVLASFNVLARQTDDVERGVSAFLDKRKIEW